MEFFQFSPSISPVVACVLAALGVVILGISKSGFGGSVGIIAVPLFAIAFGAQRGTAILLPLLIAADSFSIYHHFGNWDKSVLRILIPGTLFGIAAGSVLLWWIVIGPILPWHYDWSHWRFGGSMSESSRGTRETSAGLLNLLTGIICVLYVMLDRIRARFAPKWRFRPNARSGFAAGAAVGIISTLAHAAGPVAAIFLLNQSLARAAYMGTIVIYFFGINMTKLSPYTLIPGLTDWKALAIGACFVPLVPLGTTLGKHLFNRLSEALFRNVILTFTLLTGIQLILEYCTGVKLSQFFAR